jgi:hypothetical protein
VTCLSLGVGVFSCCRLRPHLLPITRIGCIASLVACGVISAALAAGKVTVKLEGEIEPECAIQSGTSSTLDLGDISQPGSKEYGFVLNCNAPFSYRLEAQYGALTNVAAATRVPPGFTAFIPYEIAVHISTEAAPVEEHCTSESIRMGHISCRFGESENKIAANAKSYLNFSWKKQYKNMITGQYTDTIRIHVSNLI